MPSLSKEKCRCWVLVLLAGIGLSASAWAQSDPEPAEESPADADLSQEDTSGQVEEILVTGSFIRRKDLTTPAPVSIITRVDMDASGLVSIGDILQNLPSQGNASNIQVNNGGSGATRVNLRGAGSNRTLVLVNGRRHVPGGIGADSAVDLNAIPLAVIERVEVLKDGASALYGSDAIAGVVNIITRKDFEGVEASAYTGSTWTGGQTYDLNVSTGWNSRDGNVVISAGYFEQLPIWAGQRDFSKVAKSYDWVCATGPDDPAWDEEQHQNCEVVKNTGAISSPQGYLQDWTGFSGNDEWDALKEKYPGADRFYNDPDQGWRPFREGGTSDQDLDGDGIADGDYYNYAPENYLVTPQQRYSLFLASN